MLQNSKFSSWWRTTTATPGAVYRMQHDDAAACRQRRRARSAVCAHARCEACNDTHMPLHILLSAGGAHISGQAARSANSCANWGLVTMSSCGGGATPWLTKLHQEEVYVQTQTRGMCKRMCKGLRLYKQHMKHGGALCCCGPQGNALGWRPWVEG